MSKDLISIIIPIYKLEKYLDRCIESIVNQTYRNLEIILVDDGSPDRCPSICDEWAEKDSRIKVIHKENGGVSSARNAGLDIAKGDYIGFVDGDDYIRADMYKTLFDEVSKNNCDIVVCSYQMNNEDVGNDGFSRIRKFDAMILIATGDYKYGVLWNKLYKRSVIKDIKMPPLECCEDLIFNYYVFKNAENISETGLRLYHYEQNESSVTKHTFAKGAFDALKSKEIMLENEKETELEKYAVRGLISSCFVLLSRIVTSNSFFDKYDYIRDYILKYKKQILSSNLYTNKEKIKVLVLEKSRVLFNLLIKWSNV